MSLTPELEKFVSAKVESDRYNSASEVVREALRLLEFTRNSAAASPPWIAVTPLARSTHVTGWSVNPSEAALLSGNILSVNADLDLDEIWAYIAADNIEATDHWIDKLFDGF